MKPLQPIPLQQVKAARRRLRGKVVRTPLVPLNASQSAASIYLKLENLQPIGSFKLRGAANAMLACDPELVRQGVYTASAGNMAQGVAYQAQRMGVQCKVLVPDHAPRTKCRAVERLGGEVIKVPFEEWWRVLVEHEHPRMRGLFLHPVSDERVMAGNGTIALEILEDLPDVEAVVIPFGGGGLSCGIASALRALKPEVRVYAAEVETAAPLKASLLKGEAASIDYRASFVDGIGGKSVLSEMWPLARRLLHDSLVVSLAETAQALRLTAERNHVIAEGAGAAAVAAALGGGAGQGKVVCVISGGNIDSERLIAVLSGRPPHEIP
ncbi:MAG TPA: pyridoxal-phosphate dependent enzyme [Acidobacteriota bacterium]|nr:pyridoxal-phosphate dependent enzyme [Acidobacteriota bacterium]